MARPGHLLGEVLRQDREAQHRGGARGGDDRPTGDGTTPGRPKQQRELGGHRQGERAGEEQLGRDAGAAQALGESAQQQRARGKHHRHQDEMLDDGRAIEPATSASHGAAHRPCSDQEVPTPMADSGAMRQKRGSW